jgi:hypothetical protein
MPSFELSRSIEVAAPLERVKTFVTDFHEWVKWSPWEDLDADLTRTYSGAERGVGARYGWVGKKAGAGSMAITGSEDDRVAIDLDFVKPFKAENKVVFRFEPVGDSTRVTWTMSGNRNLAFAIMGKLFFDSMIGKDFEKGLARLKTTAEA